MTQELTTAEILKFADLQMAAEAFLISDDLLFDRYSGPMLVAALTIGNRRASKFTPLQAQQFESHWKVVTQVPNTDTGFSATLFQCKESDPANGSKAGEYVVCFRSTEFLDDAVRDNLATNAMELSETGFAWGQLNDMEKWYKEIQRDYLHGQPFSVTGYSLGGHLATAFNQLHGGADAPQRVVTFNGAGIGLVEYEQSLASALAIFSKLRADPGLMEQLFLYPDAAAAFKLILTRLGDGTSNLDQELIYSQNLINGAVGNELGEFKLINAELKKMDKLRKTASAVPNIGSGDAEVANPLATPDARIAGEDFGYRMAVHFASQGTKAASYFSGAAQALLGKAYLPSPMRKKNQFDVVGDTWPSMVSNSQWHAGRDVRVFIEDQPNSRGGMSLAVAARSLDYKDVELLVDGFASKDFGDTHSLVLLVDSLNTQNALLRLVSEELRPDAADVMQGVLKDASNLHTAEGDFGGGGQGLAEGDVMENLLNALGGMLLGPQYAAQLKGNPNGGTWASLKDLMADETHFDANGNLLDDTIYSGRKSFYGFYYKIVESQAYQTLLSNGSVKLARATTDGMSARTDFGAFLSLEYLAPFALKGNLAAMQVIRSANSEKDELWTADLALSEEELAQGKANFSDQYLVSRAAMAARLKYFNQANLELVTPEARFYQRVDNIVWNDRLTEKKLQLGPLDDNTRYVIFGGQDGEGDITGAEAGDTLFGGAGADRVYGNGGHDWLEGNSGDDILVGGAGDDIMLGGAGADTYYFNTGDGADTILDGDDDGKIQINGALITGGKAVTYGANTWKGEGNVRYSLGEAEGKKNLRIWYGEKDMIVINNYKDGAFGLKLKDDELKVKPPAAITGEGPYYDEQLHLRFDRWGGSQWFDSFGNDEIHVSDISVNGAGTHHNVIWDTRGGDDVIYGNERNDYFVLDNDYSEVDGNATVYGGGGADVFLAYGRAGTNYELHAGHKIDMSKAPVIAADPDAKGVEFGIELANSTIVGGAGNDTVLAGLGDTLVWFGPGQNQYRGGVWVNNHDWGYPTRENFTEPLGWGSWDFTGVMPKKYYGISYEGIPVGGGNSTLHGGNGDSKYWLGNGDDYLMAGKGNDSIHAGLGVNTIFGGDGNDTIWGSGGTNYIEAGGGNDLIVAQGGNNRIFGGSGRATIMGGLNTDDWATSTPDAVNFIRGGTGDTVIWGSGGTDTLWAGSGRDTIYAGDGETTIIGGDNEDYLRGGAGKNIIYTGNGGTDAMPTRVEIGAGDTTVYGGSGRYKYLGGKGNSVIHTGEGGTANKATEVVLGTGNTTVYGAGYLHMWGGSGTDVMYAGNDGTAERPVNISIGSGSTTVYGGAGVTDIFGGAKGALIYTGDGGTAERASYIKAGAGADTIVAGAGHMFIDGGTSATVYQVNRGSGTIGINTDAGTIQFGPDISPGAIRAAAGTVGGAAALSLEFLGTTIVIRGGLTGGGTKFAFDGGEVLSVSELMNDVFNSVSQIDGPNGSLQVAPRSHQRLQGGTGSDTLVAYNGDNTLIAGSGDSQLHAFGSGNALIGGTGKSKLYGGSGNDTLRAGSGNDTLYAGDGQQLLVGGGGAVLMHGGSGSNTLVSGSGASTMIGGSGPTTFEIDGTDDVVLAQDGAANVLRSAVSYALPANVQTLQFIGNANVEGWGNTGTSTLIGNAGNVTLWGGAGNDTLIGGSGASELHAGGGNQLLQGGSGASMLYGGRGSDTLIAGSGPATLYGGLGDTLMQGGSGADVLMGGYGNATLVAGHGGNDTLLGGARASVFRVGAGIGAVMVRAGTGGNVIEFGAEIDLAQVVAQVRPKPGGSDLVLVLNGNGDQVTVVDGTAATVQRFAFAGGVTLTTEQVMATLVHGAQDLAAPGNGALVGGAGNDTLDGGSGYRIARGEGGHDTYILKQGNGVTQVVETAGQASSVLLGAGAALDDVTLVRAGANLVVGLRGSLASLVFQNYYTTGQDVSISTAGGVSASVQGLFAQQSGQNGDQDKLAALKAAYGIAVRAADRPASHQREVGGASYKDVVTDLEGGSYTLDQTRTFYFWGKYHEDSMHLTRQFVDLYSNSNDAHVVSKVDQASSLVSGNTSGSRTVDKSYESRTVTEVPQYGATTFYSVDDLLGRAGRVPLPAGAVPVYGISNDPFEPAPLLGFTVRQTLAPTYVVNIETISYSYQVETADAVVDETVAIEHIVAGPDTKTILTAQRHQVVYAAAADVLISSGADPYAPVRDEAPWGYDGDGTPVPVPGNLLAAGSGHATIVGGIGDDVLVSGAGDSFLNGAGGKDTYHILAGHDSWTIVHDTGVAELDEQEDPNAMHAAALRFGGDEMAPAMIIVDQPPLPAVDDVVTFEAGIAPADLRYSWGVFEGEGLRQSLDIGWGADAGVRVAMAGPGDPAGWGIEKFAFADGTVLGMADLLALAPARPQQGVAGLALAHAPASQTVDGAASFSYTVAAHTFLDTRIGGQVSYALSLANGEALPAWLHFDAATSTLATVGAPAGNGVLPLMLHASNGDGYAAQVGFDLNVINAAPGAFTFSPGMGAQVAQRTVSELVLTSLAAANVAVSRDGTTLIIADKDSADSVRIPGWYADAAAMPAMTARFADGAVWQAAALTERGLTVVDLAGAGVLAGLPGFANVLVAGRDSTLLGGTGNDTFVLGRGDGTVHITAQGQDNVVKFDSSVANPFLTAAGPAPLELRGSELLLHYGDGGDAVILHGFNPADAMTSPHVDLFAFADGSSIAFQDLAALGFNLFAGNGNVRVSGTNLLNNLYGGSGNATLVGSGHTDVFYGGSGLDVMIGGTGNETFVVNNKGDIIEARADAASNRITTSVSYTMPVNTSSMSGTGSAALLLQGNAADNTINGSAGNDTLNGGAGNDVLNGGAGADRLAGGAGDDTYLQDVGGDTLIELAGEGYDTVRSSGTHTLAPNIEALIMTGTQAIHGTGNASDNLIWGNENANGLTGGGGNDILQAFGGNDTLADTLGNNLFDGGWGIDRFVGSPGNELFAGGAGVDTVTTGSGADVIVANRGDGRDIVNASTGKDNTVSLGKGIVHGDLRFQKTANDLILITGAADRLTFKDWYLDPANRSVATLQMVVENTAAYAPLSTDVRVSKKVVQFDFGQLASAFDAACVANPALTAWSLSDALFSAFIGGSDSQAIGGALAYNYGMNGVISGSTASMQADLANALFGAGNQDIRAAQAGGAAVVGAKGPQTSVSGAPALASALVAQMTDGAVPGTVTFGAGLAVMPAEHTAPVRNWAASSMAFHLASAGADAIEGDFGTGKGTGAGIVAPVLQAGQRGVAHFAPDLVEHYATEGQTGSRHVAW